MSIRKPILIVSLLMFLSSGIYFFAAYSQMEESTDQESQIQTMFFAASAVMFMPIGVWMLKNRLHSRAPYVFSIIIATVLIIFYIVSRTINLPVVGVQDDVGPLDIASKAVQLGIIGMSIPVMKNLKKLQVYPSDHY